MKIYRGRRDRVGDPVVEVIEEIINGSQAHDIDSLKCYPLKHVVKHSTGGFEWSYAGFGPTELARCILLDLGDIVDVDVIYHAFRRQYLEDADYEGFMISEAQIRAWYEYKTEGDDNNE